MAGALRIELAEFADVVKRDGRRAERFVFRVNAAHTGQVQHRVKQHRSVSDGENEPIPVWPDRILGIKAQKLLPQTVNHRGHRHGCAGMT